MDVSSALSFNRSDTSNLQEERNFSRLFEVILNTVINLKQVPERNIELAIVRSKQLFTRFTFPDVSKWDNFCGYLFRYASHGAGLTRSRVLEAVRNCDALTLCLKFRDLKIVSLGGGPGNDVIGLCSALYECKDNNRVCLDITVVDSFEEWSICVNLAKMFIAEGNFGNVSDLFRENIVKISSLQVKLPGDPMKDYYYLNQLRKADVVLMAKLISILDWNTAKSLIKTLYESVKKEALIIYIDSPIEDEVKKYFDVLYSSEEGNNYMSSATSERFNSDDRVKSKAQIAVLRKKLYL